MPLSEKNIQSLKNDLVGLIQNRQYKTAERLYPRYKNQNITDADIWKYFAGIHSERGNIEELINCCKKILKINPDDSATAYNLGASLQNLNRIHDAIEQYEACIASAPNHINAIANCAHLYLLTGDAIRSVTYYRRALEQIDTPDIRLQYGQALLDSGDYENALVQLKHVLTMAPEDKKAQFLIAQCYYESRNYIESEKHYLKLLQTDKNNINAINNLGRVYEEAGKLEKAIVTFQRAISIDNNNAVIYLNLGKVLVKNECLNDAEKAFNKALKIDPNHPETYFNLAKIYNDSNETAKAKEYFIKALSMNAKDYLSKPEEFNLAVKYFLAEIENPSSFDVNKKAFIADLFDGYAEKFESHLVKGLDYQTPEVINDLLMRYITKKDNNTIDLGCGTGLCCKYLRNISTKIIGVDLSSKMIEKARHHGCYDKLITGEITEITNDLNESFNLIVAADVFVYIGSLNEIFAACENKISKNGYFIFSTEMLPDDLDNNYKMYDSGRYKHSTGYLDYLSSENGFELVKHQLCAHRKENGKGVKGYVTILRKT